jgi:hypothetical protein
MQVQATKTAATFHPLREQTGKSLEIVAFSLYFYLIEGLKIHSIFDYAKI